MLAQDRDEAVARYRARFAQHGYHPLTLGWTKGRMKVRFQAAVEWLEPFRSILDVGCGFGDLFGFLTARGWQGEYLGVDIVPELLDEARARYGPAGAKFVCQDITEAPLNVKADVAVAIGIFNHKLHEDNLVAIRKTLAAMWRSTSVAVVGDFLSATADQRRADLYYASPADIVMLAQEFSKRVVTHHGYMPFEFNIKIWHDDGFTTEAPVFSPYRGYIERD